MATAAPSDLVLLDIQLPGLDGFALMLRPRAQPHTSGVPATAVSADAMPETTARGRASGLADYLTKPVDTDRLAAALQVVLPRR